MSRKTEMQKIREKYGDEIALLFQLFGFKTEKEMIEAMKKR